MTSEPFDTETMAELLARQGRIQEALTIYQRLLASAGNESISADWARRIAELQSARACGTSIAITSTDDGVTVNWVLPEGIASPAIQVVFIVDAVGEVTTEKRTIAVGSRSGSLPLAIAAATRRVLAAAGFLDGNRFVPLVHGAQT